MNIIGLDVGFARNRATSGVAHFSDALALGHATADWRDRERVLGPLEDVDVAAIDAPIVPDREHGQRGVERLLCSGRFQRRCKPGASHVRGTGQELRRAGYETANQLAFVTSGRSLSREFPRVWVGRNLVEAFPNAFLGVCLEDHVYADQPKLKRGKKFDWLYSRWCSDGLFRRIALLVGLENLEVANACEANTHHEERAALVCLLTAASVASGNYVSIGDRLGGYIFLPPWDFWAQWAREEVEKQWERFPSLDVWISGSQLASNARGPE